MLFLTRHSSTAIKQTSHHTMCLYNCMTCVHCCTDAIVWHAVVQIQLYDQCFCFSRNIAYTTPKTIYFHYLKNMFSGSKYPKNILLNSEIKWSSVYGMCTLLQNMCTFCTDAISTTLCWYKKHPNVETKHQQKLCFHAGIGGCASRAEQCFFFQILKI